MGSEDFAFVTQEVPSTSLYITAGNAKEGYSYPLYHPKAMFSDDLLNKGAAVYAAFAKDWLENN